MELGATLALAAIGLSLVAEIGVRVLGLVDFPLYSVDGEIGYVAKPDQSGAFLRTNDWYFNDKSMPIGREWDHGAHPNLLLIGNSIIMGGNPFQQRDKLAPRLQALFGDRLTIWPMAIGGWTQINEMAYLARHPDVVANADAFAWECMSGGLHGGTPWAGEYVFPTRRPVVAVWYLARRYLVPKILRSFEASELPITGASKTEFVDRFAAAVDGLAHGPNGRRKGLVWLYPTLAELKLARSGRDWLPERGQIEAIARRNGVAIVDLAASPRWTEALYSPRGIHPTAAGNAVIASILHDAIQSALEGD